MNERESLGDSLAHLGRDLADLFRAELALFKREAGDEARKLLASAVWVAAAAVMGIAFLGAFTALAIIALSLVFAPWLAALVVSVVYGGLAVALLSTAAAKLKSATPVTLDETTRSVKEDVQWIKSGLKSAK